MSAEDHRRIAELAGRRAVHQTFAWLHLHEPRIRGWQLEFLPIAAPPFKEQSRSAWFAERFQDLGLHRVHVDAAGNALAELGHGPPGAPVVLVSAHLDTVFAEGTNCTPHEETPGTGPIACPGACDNGAGLAALLGIAAALRAAKITPACTLLFTANTGEEGEGDLRGMRHLFGASDYATRIQAAIALEGGGTAAVVDRALGSRRLRVTMTGPGGHSWADAGRPNPILVLGEALAEMAKLRLASNPRTTLNCGTISGGTSVNSIPESVTAQIEVRSTSALELDRTELAVLGILERTANAAGGLALAAERIGDRPVGALAANSPLMASLRAVDRHLGLKTERRSDRQMQTCPCPWAFPPWRSGPEARARASTRSRRHTTPPGDIWPFAEPSLYFSMCATAWPGLERYPRTQAAILHRWMRAPGKRNAMRCNMLRRHI